MGFRLLGVVQAKKILRQTSSSAGQSITRAADVPKGYLAVYVREEQKKRYVIPIMYLNQCPFQDLLNQAEEQFGYDHPMGGLTILCREEIFVDLISHFSLK